MVQWLRLQAPSAGAVGSVLGWAAAILHATQCGQKSEGKKNFKLKSRVCQNGFLKSKTQPYVKEKQKKDRLFQVSQINVVTYRLSLGLSLISLSVVFPSPSRPSRGSVLSSLLRLGSVLSHQHTTLGLFERLSMGHLVHFHSLARLSFSQSPGTGFIPSLF